MTYLKAMGQGHILTYFKGTQFGGGRVQNLANLANLIQLALIIDAHGISGVFG